MINPFVYIGLKTPEDIACEKWAIEKYKLYIKTREREVTEARFVLIWYRSKVLKMVARKATEPYPLSLQSVKHAGKVIRDLYDTDAVFKFRYEQFQIDVAKLPR